MANLVYIVKTGIWSEISRQFLMSSSYYSSLKKAIDIKERILRDDKAENVRQPFTADLYTSLIESTDYINSKGEQARIIIEKENVW